MIIQHGWRWKMLMHDREIWLICNNTWMEYMKANLCERFCQQVNCFRIPFIYMRQIEQKHLFRKGLIWWPYGIGIVSSRSLSHSNAMCGHWPRMVSSWDAKKYRVKTRSDTAAQKHLQASPALSVSARCPAANIDLCVIGSFKKGMNRQFQFNSRKPEYGTESF